MTSADVPAATPDSSQLIEVASSSEPRSQRRGRRRRRVRLYIVSVALVALVAGLIVLGSANTRHVKLSWAVGSTDVSLAWVILAAFIGGWLLGFVTAIVLRYRTRAPR
jgi:uncharacterized integral membrane protein